MIFAAVLAFACAFFSNTAFAQGSRDPLIVPQEGGPGSRFQIVGQQGWAAGETVTISLAFTTDASVVAAPDAFAGPFTHQRMATVLRDGTWSFPISVSDDLLSMPLDGTDGYIVVRAQAASHTASNTFHYSPTSTVAGAMAASGWGPDGASPTTLWGMMLFAAAVGGLLVMSGVGRRSSLDVRGGTAGGHA